MLDRAERLWLRPNRLRVRCVKLDESDESAEGEPVTPERQKELQRRIDERFDQFSLDDLRAANSGAMTFGLAFPGLPLREREFAEKYFSRKMDELRAKLRVEPNE